MDKLMSIFKSDKKKSRQEEGDEEVSEAPPLDIRRKWSISRSGRMKQANKKRHSISTDHYGESFQPVEKPSTVEYHVNSPVTVPRDNANSPKVQMTAQTHATEPRTPEEEIDNAFEIIDKAS